MFAVQSMLDMWGVHALGLGPLHVLTIGYFMSTLVGMVSRVIRGHSGRPVVADRWMLSAWWGVQAVVLMRLAGELMPVTGPLNLSLLASKPLLIIALTLLLIAAKAIVLYLLGRWQGLEAGPSRRLALALAQGGEFAFVLIAA